MSVVKECYICVSAKGDKMSYYYEEPKEIQEENMKNVAVWNTVIQLAYEISDLRAENARLEKQRVEELKRAEESKKKEMKDILQKLEDTQKELETTKAQHEKIIQQREEEIEEEKMKNVGMCNAMIQLAHKISDLRAENAELGRTVTQLQDQLQAERVKHSEDNPIEPQQEPGGHDKRTSINDFNFIGVLGQGGFGKVLLAQRKATKNTEEEGEYYALKAVKKEVTVRRNYIRHIEVELSILEQLRGHPFIVSLFSCFQTDANLLFVLEYAQGGDLRKLLEANTIIWDPSASFYAAEIAIAIQFLHSRGVLHRDLKLDNVLLDKEGHVKVTDFGLSAVGVTETDRITGFCGTPHYIAPEVILRQQYGHAIDWWALGVMIFEMVTGFRPFVEDEHSSVLDIIVKDDVECPEWLTDNAISIIEGFLKKDPQQRLSKLEEVRQHPFFGDIEWKELENRKVAPPLVPECQETREHCVNVSALLTPNLSVNENIYHFNGLTFSQWE